MNNPLQQLIQRHHVHPNNSFIKFDKKDVELSVPERFQKQVDMHPEHIAVKTGEHVFTYNALNQFANRIARAILTKREHLRRSKAERQAEPIAMLFESGAPIIAAILGVLKVGKFYVPLDTSLPQTRISYILKDSQAGLLLTDSRNISFAKKLQISGLEILNIDEIDFSISCENLDLPLQPDNFAYIIYTSGSTGQPKGVIQNHRYVLHLTMNYTNSSHICANDKLALLYSPNFAGAVRDIFCSLLNGATLLPYNVKQEGLIGLSSWLKQQEITIFFAVATMFRHFVNTLTQQDKFPKLRLIQVGSETVYKKDVELYKQHFSDDCIFVANLGGSEISPIRQYFVDQETEITGSTVPAGYAVEDHEVLLIDDQGKLVEFNQIGEIVVRSRYLFCGYWQRPDLTEAVLFKDVQEENKLLYKTGDLGCMLPDGCLLHLGRKDFQVKVRGYRIDVSEVEMALINTNLIREAAVVASPDHLGLRAYIVPLVPQQALSLRELRSLLLKSLPDYMVPSTFMTLEALPLTPNGKVDRLGLPAFSQVQRAQLESLVLPHTPTEQILIDIWTKILGIEEIGIHDNFFELGGHSLLVNELILELFNTFSINIPLITVFELPTIAQLAKRIENTRRILVQKDVLDSTDDCEEGML
ncbi:non-ribosomal peptide synthetase [Nostoc sp. 'Lobaria pulmonaria (5183) cyanobiont']|uniref:non-ribosomal peptide synthetase n=1 Tax=Nostoc sp. 'Lobaria pulmonaria (5183) cyanobiont' TaxID=1618022 RepID=UPI000CF31AE3|nr:non-ribosomal peptide synthetase [Nostoc sp. 'Lobaria pulmonaria (5183) cyanobiont']AVH71771.1 non-ribosomal peptide synthetase [Nostoc sp. 'Lobaria pulmonaria (5183) cyanobiont']